MISPNRFSIALFRDIRPPAQYWMTTIKYPAWKCWKCNQSPLSRSGLTVPVKTRAISFSHAKASVEKTNSSAKSSTRLAAYDSLSSVEYMAPMKTTDANSDVGT